MRRVSLASMPTCLAVLLLGVVVAGPGCGSSQTSDKSLVFVQADAAETLIQGQRKGLLGLGGTATAVWVDPRQEHQYKAGHIVGAINLPLQWVAQDHDVLDPYDIIIVYGDNFNDAIANSLSKRLIELGHSDVRTLEGGLKAWTDAGYSIETNE